jgi:prepilin-type N-terminal cleavage/methylation domain-containing protein
MGFTLVEIMVSTAVLGLLAVALAQVTELATLVTISSRKHMDADSQARAIFDRMEDDFSKMARRTDADYIFYKNAAATSGNNDAMFFYSEAPAYANGAGNSSSISLIGYRVNATTLQLERLGEALSWDATTSNDASSTTSNSTPGAPVFLSYAGTATPAFASTLDGNWIKTIGTPAKKYTDGTDSDYHAIGEQTYRLELNFLLSDGTISTKPLLSTAPSTWPSGPDFYTVSTSDPGLTNDGNTANAHYYTVGSRWYNTGSSRGYICTSAKTGAAVWQPIGTQDTSAIVVAIAILDDNSRKIVSDTSKMVGALPDSLDGALPEQTWGNSSYLTASGLPAAAAGQIRIYQRYFYLNNR